MSQENSHVQMPRLILKNFHNEKQEFYDIQKLVKMKDTVTKYENYLIKEQDEKIKKQREFSDRVRNAKENFEELQKRRKKLKKVLNDFFAYFKIGIKEDFIIYDDDIGKNYEQIGRVVEINHYLTLVEMKWEKEPIGVDKVARFMSRLLVRKNVDGIIISYSSFAETAIPTVKEALALSALALVDLRDIFDVLDPKKDLAEFFSEVIKNVKLYKNPKPIINISNLKDIDFSLYL